MSLQSIGLSSSASNMPHKKKVIIKRVQAAYTLPAWIREGKCCVLHHPSITTFGPF